MGYGKDIRRKRRELDISQAQMAEELGVTQAWISYIESETSMPSDEVKEKISEFFKAHEEAQKK